MNDPANQSSPKQLLSDDVKEDDIDLPVDEDLDEPIEESNEPVRDVAALISAIEWDFDNCQRWNQRRRRDRCAGQALAKQTRRLSHVQRGWRRALCGQSPQP